MIGILKQPENVANEINEVYRCLIPKLPVAENAIFREETNGNLEFLVWRRDEKRPERESGYMVSASGDSGSPIVKKIYDTYLKKKRHVTIGVNFGHVPIRGRFDAHAIYSTDITEKCRVQITKLNEDIVKWLGLVMDYEKNCDANPKSCGNDIPVNGN